MVFGASCNKAMYQHVIHYRLTASECWWKHIDGIKKNMRLVRPDAVVQAGAFDVDSLEWVAWVNGFLHEDWSGNASKISKVVGQALLNDLEQDQEKDRQGDGVRQPQQEKNGQEGGGVHQENGGDNDYDGNAVRRTKTPPQSAIVEPSVIVGPDDSVSVAAGGRRRHRSTDQSRSRSQHPRRHRVIQQIENDLIVGAHFLFRSTAYMDGLRYRQRGQEDSGRIEMELNGARRRRWRLVRELVGLEKNLNAARRHALLGSAGDGPAAAVGVYHDEVPRALVGGLWLHFLVGNEERFVVDQAMDAGELDVEIMVTRIGDMDGIR
ncbi:hypothetical protein CH63R_14569 [Colletotrichum higginsianum IMI 349063]|uniref:Uncharacterized protein n=1 Tax=Colletotrichum higginsianum (strain IMI 349063) TaxID=759273 RepID=A0A1B7XQG5_COLHI|nr:hypothetical protein CH63R_14569 [Colletotrichum higginsianum IMI 349063]OBR01997.1 hypothetical protein CH63R_14569 [Colletotrichum higginsianum IMI 349063]